MIRAPKAYRGETCQACSRSQHLYGWLAGPGRIWLCLPCVKEIVAQSGFKAACGPAPKLSREQADHIRSIWKRGKSYRQIGRQFGVAPDLVKRVVNWTAPYNEIQV